MTLWKLLPSTQHLMGLWNFRMTPPLFFMVSGVTGHLWYNRPFPSYRRHFVWGVRVDFGPWQLIANNFRCKWDGNLKIGTWTIFGTWDSRSPPNCDIFNSFSPIVTPPETKTPPKFGQMPVTSEGSGLMRWNQTFGSIIKWGLQWWCLFSQISKWEGMAMPSFGTKISLKIGQMTITSEWHQIKSCNSVFRLILAREM